MVRQKKSTPKKGTNPTENWVVKKSKRQIDLALNSCVRQKIVIKDKVCEQTENLYYIGNLRLGKVITEENDAEIVNSIIIQLENIEPFLLQNDFDVHFIKDTVASPFFFYNITFDENSFLYINLSLLLPIDLDASKQRFVKNLKQVIKHLFGDESAYTVSDEELKKKHDIDELYEGVRSCTEIDVSKFSYEVQHPCLKPKLRPYQVQAVKWMLHREHNPLFPEGEKHPVYQPLTLPNKQVLYYNSITGDITESIPIVKCDVTGGILADEMGLGKTVEVLACILCNPRDVSDIDVDATTLPQDMDIFTQKSIIVINQNKTKNLDKKLKAMKEKHQKTFQMDHDYVPEVKMQKVPERPPRQKRKVTPKKIVENIEESEDESKTDKRAKKKLKKDKDDPDYVDSTSQRKNSSKRIVSTRSISNKRDVSSSDEDIPLAQLVKKDSTKTKKSNKKFSELFKKYKDNKNPFIKKPKSQVKLIAQKWYEEKLAETNLSIFRQLTTLKIEMHCLCGSFDKVGNEVTCVDCSNKQHRLCVNYEGDASDYYCPQCWIKRPLIKTGATLIITPSSLSKQWVSEIRNHIVKNGLKVLVYTGVRSGYLYPTNIAKYDIVLTTYHVLQTEIKYVKDDDSTRGLRFEKKYHVATSPLLSLEWWRICLDEAQIVESTLSDVANMARRLNSVHKWAVSGTPAQRGINDLYGLILFLGIEPYCDIQIWKKCLYMPYCVNKKEPLHKFLAKVMWRVSKKDVIDQIDIPKQTEIIHWLKFSAVETYFYNREHELCQDSFQERLTHYDSLNITLNSLDRRELAKLLIPLLSIRQACTHPKVVRGKYLKANNEVMSMEDLLEALISKSELECSDGLRRCIAALNGLAGIHIIEARYLQASECYREVLRLIDQHKDDFPVDTLPHLHTLHNLAELLSNNHNIPPTLHDDKLKEEAENLEEKYTEKHVNGVKTATYDYSYILNLVKKLENKFIAETSEWFPGIVMWIEAESLTHDLISRLQSALHDHTTTSNLAEKLKTPWTIIYELSSWWDKVTQNITNLRKDFQQLKKLIKFEEERVRFPDDSVHKAVICHLRPIQNKDKDVKRKKCFMCVIEKQMLEYECLIFLINKKHIKTQRKKISDGDKKMEGSWKSCEQEVLLKTILNFGRQKGADENFILDGEIHLKLCNALKKEFKEMRKLWTYYGDLIASQDEISMCKERIRLRLGNEEIPKFNKRDPTRQLLRNLEYNIENKLEHINVIDISTINAHFTMFTNDKVVAEADFNKKLGTLAYLKTLRKQTDKGANLDPCPICTNPLKDSWSVLVCGHSFCLECIHHLLSKYCNGVEITCSVCRRHQPVADISYVKFKLDQDEADVLQNKVTGSFSTKIEAIVKCVLELYNENNDVKILVFSKWNQALKVISEAFSVNKIKFLCLFTANPVILERFKDKDEGITVLLLPVNLGARGLNLIEATHVILVEPLLNPGEELQAIGRVHRIGQTKPTFVHRFLIKNTVEESIYNAVSSNSSAWEKDNVTLAKIYDLFVKPEDTTNPRNIQSTENDLRITEVSGGTSVMITKETEVSEGTSVMITEETEVSGGTSVMITEETEVSEGTSAMIAEDTEVSEGTSAIITEDTEVFETSEGTSVMITEEQFENS